MVIFMSYELYLKKKTGRDLSATLEEVSRNGGTVLQEGKSSRGRGSHCRPAASAATGRSHCRSSGLVGMEATRDQVTPDVSVSM